MKFGKNNLSSDPTVAVASTAGNNSKRRLPRFFGRKDKSRVLSIDKSQSENDEDDSADEFARIREEQVYDTSSDNSSNNYGQDFEARDECNDYTMEVNDHYYASQEYIPEVYFDHLRNEHVELNIQGQHVEVNDFALEDEMIVNVRNENELTLQESPIEDHGSFGVYTISIPAPVELSEINNHEQTYDEEIITTSDILDEFSSNMSNEEPSPPSPSGSLEYKEVDEKYFKPFDDMDLSKKEILHKKKKKKDSGHRRSKLERRKKKSPDFKKFAEFLPKSQNISEVFNSEQKLYSPPSSDEIPREGAQSPWASRLQENGVNDFLKNISASLDPSALATTIPDLKHTLEKYSYTPSNLAFMSNYIASPIAGFNVLGSMKGQKNSKDEEAQKEFAINEGGSKSEGIKMVFMCARNPVNHQVIFSDNFSLGDNPFSASCATNQNTDLHSEDENSIILNESGLITKPQFDLNDNSKALLEKDSEPAPLKLQLNEINESAKSKLPKDLLENQNYHTPDPEAISFDEKSSQLQVPMKVDHNSSDSNGAFPSKDDDALIFPETEEHPLVYQDSNTFSDQKDVDRNSSENVSNSTRNAVDENLMFQEELVTRASNMKRDCYAQSSESIHTQGTYASKFKAFMTGKESMSNFRKNEKSLEGQDSETISIKPTNLQKNKDACETRIDIQKNFPDNPLQNDCRKTNTSTSDSTSGDSSRDSMRSVHELVRTTTDKRNYSTNGNGTNDPPTNIRLRKSKSAIQRLKVTYRLPLSNSKPNMDKLINKLVIGDQKNDKIDAETTIQRSEGTDSEKIRLKPTNLLLRTASHRFEIKNDLNKIRSAPKHETKNDIEKIYNRSVSTKHYGKKNSDKANANLRRNETEQSGNPHNNHGYEKTKISSTSHNLLPIKGNKSFSDRSRRREESRKASHSSTTRGTVHPSNKANRNDQPTKNKYDDSSVPLHYVGNTSRSFRGTKRDQFRPPTLRKTNNAAALVTDFDNSEVELYRRPLSRIGSRRRRSQSMLPMPTHVVEAPPPKLKTKRERMKAVLMEQARPHRSVPAANAALLPPHRAGGAGAAGERDESVASARPSSTAEGVTPASRMRNRSRSSTTWSTSMKNMSPTQSSPARPMDEKRPATDFSRTKSLGLRGRSHLSGGNGGVGGGGDKDAKMLLRGITSLESGDNFGAKIPPNHPAGETDEDTVFDKYLDFVENIFGS